MGFDGGYPQFLAWRGKIYGYAMAFVLWGGGEANHARGCKYISSIMGCVLISWVCSCIMGCGMLIKWGGFQISDFS